MAFRYKFHCNSDNFESFLDKNHRFLLIRHLIYSAVGLDVLFWLVSPLYSMNSYYRFYVYTRCEVGISEKQIFEELAKVHQDPCPSLQTINWWILEIQNKSPGRPILTVNAANVQRVGLLIEEDCRLFCRDIEEQTKIPKTCVHDTGKRFHNL